MTDLTALPNLDVPTSPPLSRSKAPKLSTLAFRALERKLFAGPNTAAVELGCAPYFILEPMLKRASPLHLMQIELYNEHLVEDTGDLWKVHVQREWPTLTVDYDEEKLGRTNWRKLYHKQHAEQEAKIASIGAKMRSRYSELSAEKEKKKIVLVDKVFPSKSGRPRNAWGSSTLPGGSVGQKGSRVVNKVRAELKRSAALFRHPEAPISKRLPGISYRMDSDSQKLPSLPVTPESGIRMTTLKFADTPVTASANIHRASVSGGGLPQRQEKPLADTDEDLGGVSKEETRRLLDAMKWNPSATKSKPYPLQSVPRPKPKPSEAVSLFIPKRKTNETRDAGKSRVPGIRNLASPAASSGKEPTASKRKPETMKTNKSVKRQKE